MISFSHASYVIFIDHKQNNNSYMLIIFASSNEL